MRTLQRSSLPTVVTEGYEDYFAFRRMEAALASLKISFLPAGGKCAVLEVYRRRAEFADLRTAFVVDRDLWLFAGTPAEFDQAELIQTDGCSLENDLYRDGQLERFLYGEEVAKFAIDCRAICEWYSFAVRSHLSGRPTTLDFHPNVLLLGPGTLNPKVLTQCHYTGPCAILFPQISANYARDLRGKTLLQLLTKHLAYPGRPAKHSSRALMEYASTVQGRYMQTISEKLSALFSPA